MNLTITNDTCEDIVYNGNYLEKLYYNGDLVWEKRQPSYIDQYKDQYFTMEALEDGSLGWVTFSLGRVKTGTGSGIYIDYSKNGGRWVTCNEYTKQITVKAGDTIRLRRVPHDIATPSCNKMKLQYTPTQQELENRFGKNSGAVVYYTPFDQQQALNSGKTIYADCRWNNNIFRFLATCKYKVYGNFLSLFYGNPVLDQYNFKYVTQEQINDVVRLSTGIFSECWLGTHISIHAGASTGDIPDYRNGNLPIDSNSEAYGDYDKHFLVDAKNLYIPCPYQTTTMFYNCQLLEHGPFIEPEALKHSQFDSTFYCCYSLKEAKYDFDFYMNDSSRRWFWNSFNRCYSMTEGPSIIRSWFDENNIWKKYNKRWWNCGELVLTNTFFACESLVHGPKIYGYNENDGHVYDTTLKKWKDTRYLIGDCSSDKNYNWEGPFCWNLSLQTLELYWGKYYNQEEWPKISTTSLYDKIYWAYWNGINRNQTHLTLTTNINNYEPTNPSNVTINLVNRNSMNFN